MKYTAGIFLGLVMAALVSFAVLAAPAADDGLGIKEIMRKANGSSGLFNELRRDLREEDPDWVELRDRSRELIRLTEELRKTTPPRGDRASWNRLTRAYSDDARALEKTLTRMDKEAADKVVTRIAASCAACHKVHRKKEGD